MVARVMAAPGGLAAFLRIVDLGMIVYWSVSLAVVMGLASLPQDMMYSGYGTPLIDAWNWSFAPLDIAFAAIGLWSLALLKKGDVRWRGWAIVSLTLTMCAGGMAIAFWALQGSFDLAWWLPNLVLLLAPLTWLPRLVSGPGS